MDACLRPQVSCRFITTIIGLMIVLIKQHETCGRRQASILLNMYKKLMYIYLSLLLYNSFITDIVNSPNYTAFGLPQNHKVK